jgi:hypothetical protein
MNTIIFYILLAIQFLAIFATEEGAHDEHSSEINTHKSKDNSRKIIAFICIWGTLLLISICLGGKRRR